MGQTLTNGIFLPNEGERNCYTGLAGNWRAIDGYIGGYNVHIADAVIHVSQADRDKWDNVDNKADASALTAHTGDTTIHVTAADKEAWNGKADASALTAHTGDTTIHVTAEDKNKWDAVTTKANDADVVHNSRAETIAGAKTFTNTITSKKEVEFTGSRLAYILPEFSASYSGLILCTYSSSGAVKIGSWKVDDNDNTKHVLDSSLGYLNITTGAVNGVNSVYLTPRNTTDSKLGDSTNKWREINGINPGALSLPDLTAGVDISGYITAGNKHNEYTPTVDGWISVILKSPSGALAVFIYQGDVGNSYFGNTALPNESNFCGMATIPVKAGTVVNIDTKGSNIYVYAAKFYPCQGNV